MFSLYINSVSVVCQDLNGAVLEEGGGAASLYRPADAACGDWNATTPSHGRGGIIYIYVYMSGP